MTIAVICLLVAGLQPLFWVLLAKIGGSMGGESFDNNNPRIMLEQYRGWPQRAYWAQNNALEAFPLFSVAVLACMITGVSAELVNFYALVWIALRFLYGALYIFDRATLRSLVWSLGLLVVIRLFVAAAQFAAG